MRDRAVTGADQGRLRFKPPKSKYGKRTVSIPPYVVAALRAHLHSIRHTHVSELIASGMDVLTVSRRLGHGSPAITLTVYSHLIEGKDNEAAAVMERAFNKLRTE